MNEDLVIQFLHASNETLTAAIVVVAASMLLYNLTRNLKNRVARTSGIVLACVTMSYIADVFIALGPGRETYTAGLRVQWVGIAFIPAALLHLSDALLDTTGLPSRGRRKRIIRILYLISGVFLIAAAFTDILIIPVPRGQVVSLKPGFLFWLYVVYFALATSIAVVNVERARRRCLLRSTRRRMGYLLVAILTPPLGIFPYSLLLGIGEETLLVTLLINIANGIVILMLLFLAYPLSFFGSRIPDRVVKAELLRFMMFGPATALLALGVIMFLPPTTEVLSLPGNTFMPFAVVAVVLMWQWLAALLVPWLEKRLIYFAEDDDHLAKLQRLSDRLLTRNDLVQLVEANLEAVGDYIHVSQAFAALAGEDGLELIRTVGATDLTGDVLQEDSDVLETLLESCEKTSYGFSLQRWRSFWVTPLYSLRITREDNEAALIGLIGIEAQSPELELSKEEKRMLRILVRRLTRTLDDMLLQSELFAALEGLLPQYSTTRSRSAEVEYRKGRQPVIANGLLPDRLQMVEQVRAALRHYWGGVGLTRSGLQELTIVRAAMDDNDSNPARALRAILLQAIEQQKPEGQRKMTSPEWTIYNILQLRFVEKVKVRDVATRLALSEPDLYRKQRAAIDVVADTLLDMERAALKNAQNTPSGDNSLE